MPTYIYEDAASDYGSIAENGEGGTWHKLYNATGTTDSAVAVALAKTVAPLALLVGVETLVRTAIDPKNTGFDAWKLDVSYSPENKKKSQERPKPGTWKFSFNTSGGRHKIVKSKQTISRHWYTGNDPAPDLKSAIGYDGSKVNGVEVYVPNGAFTITAYYEPTLVTPQLMREFGRKTPRTNSDVWLGFQPGEVIYYGTEGQGDIPTVAGQRVSPIALRHYFDASENRTNIDPLFTNGTPQASINAKGWEYLWYRHREVETTGVVLPEARWAYVERLYDDMHFADFFGFGNN